MGFMDKLKEVGKTAAKGALTMAATSYGTVIGNPYGLCKISMSGTSKIVIVKVTEIVKELTIANDIQTFYLESENTIKMEHTIALVTREGEKILVLLNVDKNRGSGLSTAEARLAAHYEYAAFLVEALAKNVPEMSDETKLWVNKIMTLAGKSTLF